MATLGLILTGGGARAAYQVGALRAIVEVVGDGHNPFPVITGVSAGAINGAALAACADDFSGGVRRLAATWLTLSPERVYRTDMLSVASIGGRWIRNLTSGGLVTLRQVNHLLDTTPLRELLTERIPLDTIPGHIAAGRLRALGVTATSYLTGTAVTFFDGPPGLNAWARSRRLGRHERLTIDHVMASAAIPVFFPPVRLGDIYYGDGQIRLTEPLSPAIHLGADRLLAVGVRYLRTAEETQSLNTDQGAQRVLPVSQVAGVLLNALFLDHLDSDTERLERINHSLGLATPKGGLQDESPFRVIPVLTLRPSRELGGLAADQMDHFPRVVRYLLRGMGAGRRGGSDLVSYLAFERSYVDRLQTLGYEDTLARKGELEEFFADKAPLSA
ncbi:MAG: patatin-like phospholipase family protein [Myxococcaceae bacterium]